jgi:glycosyltransferase involved in cell wall biosynthesis
VPHADAQTVSVLVSTYNRPAALDRVLDGLSRQSRPAEEIIVADDGSAPATAEIVARWRDRGLPLVHCWHEDDGFRKSMIMNRAIEGAHGTIALFLDGDCVPLRDFVHDHVSCFEPDCILAGPRILASETWTRAIEAGDVDIPDRSLLQWIGDRLRGRVNRLGPLVRLPDGNWRTRSPRRWEWVRGCNFSVALRALRQVGGFEEDITGWGLEDSELAVRLINAGLRVKSLRYAAPVLHLWHREGSRANLAENDRLLQAALREGRVRARRGLTTA